MRYDHILHTTLSAVQDAVVRSWRQVLYLPHDDLLYITWQCKNNSACKPPSRKGNCYDSAPMESFWGSLKNDLVHHQRYATRADAQSAIQEYIESLYNRQRRHSRLGNVPPALFAELFSKHPQAA